jgi:TRAP-type transport system small permease protein
VVATGLRMSIDTINAPDEKVLDEDGRFHASDAPIDLSEYRWLLALDVFYQFFTRYVLADSAAWTEEIARYLLIMVTFLGGAMAVRRNTHIHVEFVYRYMPASFGRVLSTFVDIARIAFLAYATFLTVQLIPKMQNLNMTVVNFSMAWIYGCVALGFLMMTYRAIQVALLHKRQGWSTLERPGEQEAV